MRIKTYDDYNGVVHSPEWVGTVVQNFARDAFRNGWKLIEIWED